MKMMKAAVNLMYTRSVQVEDEDYSDFLKTIETLQIEVEPDIDPGEELFERAEAPNIPMPICEDVPIVPVPSNVLKDFNRINIENPRVPVVRTSKFGEQESFTKKKPQPVKSIIKKPEVSTTEERKMKIRRVTFCAPAELPTPKKKISKKGEKLSCNICKATLKTQELLDAHVNRAHLTMRRRATICR